MYAEPRRCLSKAVPPSDCSRKKNFPRKLEETCCVLLLYPIPTSVCIKYCVADSVCISGRSSSFAPATGCWRCNPGRVSEDPPSCWRSAYDWRLWDDSRSLFVGCTKAIRALGREDRTVNVTNAALLVNFCSQLMTRSAQYTVYTLTRSADIALELIGDVYDENQVICIIFFADFAHGRIKSGQTLYTVHESS